MRSHELLSFLESCEQGLFMKNNEQQHDIDLNIYKAMTVVNENAFSNVAVSAYTALTNSSFGYHTRAIEVAYNEYIDFSSSRKDMAEDLKRYSANSDLLPKLNGMMALPLNFSIVEAIRPKFLLDYAYNLRDIARSSSPAKMDAEVRRIKSNDIASRLKPNCVKLSHDVLSEKFDQIDFRSYCVPVDLKYLSDAALYCANLKSTNKELNVIVTQTTSVLREVQSVIEELIPVVYDTKNTAPEAGSKSIQFVYNALKLLIDMGSYISRALVYMIKIYSVKIISISKIFDAIVSIQAITPTMEATIELNTVNATDTESVANDLRTGRADVFDDFANKLYEFHRNLLENTRYDKTKDVDSIIANHQYNRKAYDDTSKIYIMLSQGLDIISRKSDDYLIVFDHLIEKAGFQIRLEDKYRNILDSLDDVSVYRSASDLSNSGEMNLDVYLMIINEIGDFSDNMTTIAKNAFDSYQKLIGLKKRFDENIYGEYKNAEAINQLKIFFEDLVDQYKKLTNIIASKMLLRLKSMGMYADDLSKNITDNTDTVISVPHNNIEDDDFTNYAFKATAESADIFNTAEMVFCQEAYLESRMRRDTGADNVILEASPETNNNATATNGDGNNNVKNDGSLKTNASVVDNSEDAQTAKQVQTKSSKFSVDTINKICESIRKWFNNTLTSFQNIMNRKFTKDGFVTGPDGRKLTYEQFLKTYKEYLMSKNYTNTEIHILPYQSLDNILNQISSVKNNIVALKGDAIKAVNSEQDMYKKLFPFVPNLNGDVDNMKKQITTFVTVGSEKAQDVVYKNNEVANWVKKTIPALESYQTNYSAKLDADLKGLEKELENTTKTYQEAVTELFDSIYSIYTEADTPATGTPATGTPNTGTNTQQASAGQQVHPVGSTASQQKNGEDTIGIQAKANWMRSAVMYFSGVCCNVVRDKIQNSFKILAGFSDKANKAISAKNAEKQNEENQNNNQTTTESVNDMFQDMFDSVLEAVGTTNKKKNTGWKYKVDLVDKNVFKEIEKTRGIKIPGGLKQFIIANNAASPTAEKFEVEGKERVFEAVLSFNQNESDTYSGYTALQSVRDKNLFPFAVDPFGNYICYNISKNCVDFLDHGTNKVVSTRKSLSAFINSLH